ncbi:imidazolonepropionase [Thorsellia anophelis]|uniref:Imidazolonepropionase n=1 Tax=Thorsellia anophelis DSM 18579 TaxID=1123402 RepID=A0A1I0C304_9GAMM|nr:imidazolonepropionase [Thorsellia anophelis]SET13856.1 imidazolonepropionase [Thorsellia anophelis DSM 18579]
MNKRGPNSFTIDEQNLCITQGRIWMPSHPKADKEGVVTGHQLFIKGKKIEAILPDNEVQSELKSTYTNIKLEGALITPGLIDCHTHLVFAGNRAHEWQRRLAGESYEEIVKSGGGIQSTVNATIEASEQMLYELSLPRLEALVKEGVTTLEIKSGYGLCYDSEFKILSVIKTIKENHKLDISPTFLGAHAVPKAYTTDPEGYLDTVINKMLPDFWHKGLMEAVDIFCETIAFSVEDATRLFKAARELGIPIKAHAEQLSHLGTSELVANFKGLSVDHIEYLQKSDVIAMQHSGTVATLLPLAFYFLKETQKPPIDLLRKYAIPMAISTDFNPGTAPLASLRLAMNMAAVEFGLTVDEILLGVTTHAAKALGRDNTHGKIAPGFMANLAIWEVDKPVEIFYELGTNPLIYRVFEGDITN